MTQTADAIVIGAGVIGAAVTYELAKQGRKVLSLEAFEKARADITAWPGYAPTPLYDMAGLAAAAGIARLWYKDEAGRFGLGSFKALAPVSASIRSMRMRSTA